MKNKIINIDSNIQIEVDIGSRTMIFHSINGIPASLDQMLEGAELIVSL